MAARKKSNPERLNWLKRVITTFTRVRRTMRNLIDATDYATKLLQKLQAAWEEWAPATAH
ncbi:hypothetical protein [Streptomyces sp. sk226]|uniref:hypothetical protein n=1 Tax=Streptomyces sp. sk226 TaxID=2034268 RepID=UPI000BF187CC|nr:hypothetical protein [Streptomyces sp. sk226]